MSTQQYEIINIYRNYKYAVWFNTRQGYRCGYVKIPENHPLYEKFFGDIDLDSVGLTFSGKLKGLDGWYIGWDHHHLWDGIDEDGIRKANSTLSEDKLEELLEYARDMAGEPYGSFANKDDVEAECQKVIDELISKF